MTVIAIGACCIVIWRRSRYVWLVATLSLLIVGDLCYVWANWGYLFEYSCQFVVNHILLQRFTVGFGTGLFNILTNLFHWFFGFEYWYISRETPTLFRLKKSEDTPQAKAEKARFYAAIKWTGIILNVSTCTVLLYYEWRFENDLYIDCTAKIPPPLADVITLTTLEYVSAFFMLLSCLFLADALRRFKKQSTLRKNIVLNQKLMYVHISVVLLQVVVSVILFSIAKIYYESTEKFNILAATYSFSIFAIQIVIALIFVQVATPRKLYFMY